MSSSQRPYRERPQRPLAPYAAAWREHAWRLRFAYLLFAVWLLLLAYLAIRWRTWVVLVMFPAPLKALCLRNFRCPRCAERFGVSPEGFWWGAARVQACLHCGLEKGAPADPDDYWAAQTKSRPPEDRQPGFH